MKSTKRELIKGIVLLIGFMVILTLMFLPVMDGQKPLNQLDNLYNSISKGSVYYIPKLIKEAKNFQGHEIRFELSAASDQQAEEMSSLFRQTGNEVEKTENGIIITGSLNRIIDHSLADADLLFNNQGDKLVGKYGLGERNVLYYWWLGLKSIDKQLTREKRFEETRFVNSVMTKAVECSFNYYKVEPRNISTAVWFVVISLAFYVIYTLWFGFAVLYIFVGLGLKVGH